MSIPRRSANILAIALCVLFFATGVLWISRIGLQYDEVLFSGGIYPPFVRRDSVRIFKQEYPLMVMTYVGTLKAIIYRFAVFPFWEPSAASVRIPVLLLGSLSIWAFYRILIRTSGVLGGLIGCALLATDTCYLLTTRWDWGPVVLQHLCLLTGVLALMVFWQVRQRRWLVLGFFLLGLAMWDKALAVWTLVGLGAATLLIAWPFVQVLAQRRNLAIATTAFMLGCLPLIIFNVRYRLVTFRGTAKFESQGLAHKRNLLLVTLNGSGLFGYITREDGSDPARAPQKDAERLLLDVNDAIGSPRENWMPALAVLAIIAIPFARNAWRPLAFAAICGVTTWLQMAFVADAGGSVHHTILLWPLPTFFIAVSLAGLTKNSGVALKVIVMAVVLAACGRNLAVTSTYYRDMIRNGSSVIWTDAIYPAADTLAQIKPARVCVLEWGFYEQVRLLHKGRTQLCVADPPKNDSDREHVLGILRQPGNLFISHTTGNEISPGATDAFVEFARREGFEQTDLRLVHDSHGRPVIRLFRLIPAVGPQN